MSGSITVEVVAATPDRQLLLELEVPAGSIVGDVLDASRILRRFPELTTESLAFGIWGQVVASDQEVEEGDRVEVYRPLRIDPREARRQRALSGQTMRGDKPA